MKAYRTSPAELEGLPTGIPHIVSNEAAERFSFYGMKSILAVFMVQYLHLMDGAGTVGMSAAKATEQVHLFNSLVYLTPFFGALVADLLLGKYRTIIALSLVYCAGHGALAVMGVFGNSSWWLMAGLGLIAAGSGGIKPCVSAHVGDQFGAKNAHLLPKVFNWFYFSINIGAFASGLLSPWLLKWYGPHSAFGIPGVLMALATLIFWMGRHRFIHVPAGGVKLIREIFLGGGLKVMLKLFPLYLFVAMFWALFDQTSTMWIFQAVDMDLHFMGIDWLPSQIQSLNSVFVLMFIPLFAYGIYPKMDRVWRLTPLRKIGVGLLFAVASFALSAVIQQWIDSGGRPNIGWQITAYVLITMAEVMVSIVALEYAYTQAPKTMKSLLMCYYLGSVAVGNLFVAGVNHVIQIPSAAEQQLNQAITEMPVDWQKSPRTVVLSGYDRLTGTNDDLVQRLEDGHSVSIEIPAMSELFDTAIGILEKLPCERGQGLPDVALVTKMLEKLRDPWGGHLRYMIINSNKARLMSDGPDRTPDTKWDLGVIIEIQEQKAPMKIHWSDRLHPDASWLDRREKEFGRKMHENVDDAKSTKFSRKVFSGGQTRLHGADYFWFFTWVMLATVVIFVPYALIYRPKTFLQD